MSEHLLAQDGLEVPQAHGRQPLDVGGLPFLALHEFVSNVLLLLLQVQLVSLLPLHHALLVRQHLFQRSLVPLQQHVLPRYDPSQLVPLVLS